MKSLILSAILFTVVMASAFADTGVKTAPTKPRDITMTRDWK